MDGGGRRETTVVDVVEVVDAAAVPESAGGPAGTVVDVGVASAPGAGAALTVGSVPLGGGGVADAGGSVVAVVPGGGGGGAGGAGGSVMGAPYCTALFRASHT